MSAFPYGVHLDNVDQPPESSYRRIGLTRADLALTLWTAGTKHRRAVYQRLKQLGVGRLCIRVGDEALPTSVDAFLSDVDAALDEAGAAGYAEAAIDVQCLNEPNLGSATATAVGAFLAWLAQRWRRRARLVLPPVSRGVGGWQEYERLVLAVVDPYTAGKNVARAVHAYAGDAEALPPCDPAGLPVLLTEVSHPGLRGAARGAWVVARLAELARKGYGCAVQFIVDGVTGGAWDGGYRMTDDEATAIGRRGVLLRPQEKSVIKGIDVSDYQGAIDWAALKEYFRDPADGKVRGFVVIRAGEDGCPVDPWLHANATAARALAAAEDVDVFLVGFYYLAHPETTAPADSATGFGNAVSTVGGVRTGEFGALDLEFGQGDLLVWSAECLASCDQALGGETVLYTGPWFASTRNLEGHGPSFAGRRLWWADYAASAPAVPDGFDAVTIWQNSASARVPGTVGAIDTDVFEGTADELRALGKPAPMPVVVAPADPVTDALDDLFDLTLQEGPNSEDRRKLAQAAIETIKEALGRAA